MIRIIIDEPEDARALLEVLSNADRRLCTTYAGAEYIDNLTRWLVMELSKGELK